MRRLLLFLIFFPAFSSLAQEDAEMSFNSDQPELSIGRYLQLAEDLSNVNNPDSALNLLYSAEILAEGLQDLYLLNKVKFRIGKALSAKKDYASAIDYYQQSIQISAVIADTARIADTYRLLGIAYKNIAVYPKAIEAYNNSNLYYSFLKDTAGQGSTMINIGNVFKNLGQNERAKEKYRAAIKIFEPAENLNSLGDCYNNLGNVFKNEYNYDSAAFYMFKTLELRKETQNLEKLSYVYHNLANLNVQLENFDIARQYTDSARTIKEQRNDIYGVSMEIELLARIHYFKEEWSLAVQRGEEALNMAQPYQNLELNKEILRILGSAAYKMEDFKKSARYYSQFMDADETLKDLNQSDQIEFELVTFEMVSDSLQKDQLTLQKELQDAENKNIELENSVSRRNYLLTIAGLLILVIIVAYIYFLNRKRLSESQSEKEIIKKSSVPKEEKEILLKEVHHRVKNNFQIINSLIRIQSEFIDQNNYRDKLKELENRIRSMSLIHEKLYKTEQFSKLSVKDYVTELSANLLQSYEIQVKIKFDIRIDEAEYGIDSLIPLGLILNETISNSIKHGFQGKSEGLISVDLQNTKENTILSVHDDGIGADLSIEELKDESLGMELLYDLTEQLDGHLSLDTTEGFKYLFKFPRLK